jgi:hypothetical protein
VDLQLINSFTGTRDRIGNSKTKETFIGSRIVAVEKLGEDRMKAVVRCKVATEHPDGGIVSESVREFFLVREDNQWRVDGMVVDGATYVP